MNGPELRLFVHDGRGRFAQESESRGLVAPAEGECRFGVFGDVDRDGDPDLFLGVLGAPSCLYVNDGSGGFRRRVADEVGLVSSADPTSAVFADFDRDGDLDLFVAGGGNLLTQTPSPVYAATNGTRDQLFVNRGDGTFDERAEEAGVDGTGWALATAISDYDLDGDVDLYVANDFGLDRLYRNRGDGTFDEVSEEAGIWHHGASMGASWGDADGDGDPDLFVAAMAPSSGSIASSPRTDRLGPEIGPEGRAEVLGALVAQVDPIRRFRQVLCS